MKYYIANIDEQNGEFEISQTIIFRAESLEQADKIHLYTVGTWYGEDTMEWNFFDERFYNDFVAVREGYLTEIDKHTFDQVYKHFVVDMTPKSFEDVEGWHKKHSRYLKEWAESENGYG